MGCGPSKADSRTNPGTDLNVRPAGAIHNPPTTVTHTQHPESAPVRTVDAAPVNATPVHAAATTAPPAKRAANASNPENPVVYFDVVIGGMLLLVCSLLGRLVLEVLRRPG